jgi:1,4-dihydroxy-2-naphthoate octaprenyltransferase
MSETGRKKNPAPRAWHLCLALIPLLYVLLFLFRSHIPEPWTALIAVALLAIYRVLRYWLHPPVKRTRLSSSSNS